MDTLKQNNIFAIRDEEKKGIYVPSLKTKVLEAICFPYYFDSMMVNIKYRSLPKIFWQTAKARKMVFGHDDALNDLIWQETAHKKACEKDPKIGCLPMQRQLILVEGEMDKLAFNEAGFWNVTSVPDGAPPLVNNKPTTPEQDPKFEYLLSCEDLFNRAEVIVIATDMDAPGQALREELARRLGRSRCKLVKFPRHGANMQKVNKGVEESIRQIKESLKEAIEYNKMDEVTRLMQLLHNMNECIEWGEKRMETMYLY